jgi:hypothetical protein
MKFRQWNNGVAPFLTSYTSIKPIHLDMVLWAKSVFPFGEIFFQNSEK